MTPVGASMVDMQFNESVDSLAGVCILVWMPVLSVCTSAARL